jgi:hypothetical protein
MRIAANDRLGQRFDDVREVRPGIVPPQRSQQWRREDDVAEKPKADNKNFHDWVLGYRLPPTAYHLRFDGGLVDEHHRNIVSYRIHTIALTALESRAVLDERHGRFALGTGEYFEQFGIDRHDPSGVTNYNILS